MIIDTAINKEFEIIKIYIALIDLGKPNCFMSLKKVIPSKPDMR